MARNTRAEAPCRLQPPAGGSFSDDLTPLSFQGTGPDLEGSVQAWQRRRSSDDAGEDGHPPSPWPLSQPPRPPSCAPWAPLPIPSRPRRAWSLETPTAAPEQQAELQRHAPRRGHVAHRYGAPLLAQQRCRLRACPHRQRHDPCIWEFSGRGGAVRSQRRENVEGYLQSYNQKRQPSPEKAPPE